MINIGIHNYPLKKFDNENQEMVVFLVEAGGQK
jgi:hypothetical protein